MQLGQLVQLVQLVQHLALPRAELATALQTCTRTAKSEMRRIASAHRKDLKWQRGDQHKAYFKNPKKFHDAIFADEGSDPPPKMTALSHPVHGLVTDPALMLESLELHHMHAYFGLCWRARRIPEELYIYVFTNLFSFFSTLYSRRS